MAPESAAPHLRGRAGHVLLAPRPTRHTVDTVRPDAHIAWGGAPAGLGAALDQAGLTATVR